MARSIIESQNPTHLKRLIDPTSWDVDNFINFRHALTSTFAYRMLIWTRHLEHSRLSARVWKRTCQERSWTPSELKTIFKNPPPVFPLCALIHISYIEALPTPSARLSNCFEHVPLLPPYLSVRWQLLILKNTQYTLRGKLTSPNSISAFEPEHTGFKTEQWLSKPVWQCEPELVLAAWASPEQAIRLARYLGRQLSQIRATPCSAAQF
jgi:hypothetical protein